MIDTTQIDTSTTLGQVTFLIAVVVGGVIAIRPILKDFRNNKGRKNYSVIASELESVKKEQDFSVQLQRHNAEWQLVARELIRIQRYELVDAGVPIKGKLKILTDRLEEIEDRDIYSEHILIKEEE